jgi:murein DD-endopeptidase MepM/ murein hydrolase activator NlpD
MLAAAMVLVTVLGTVGSAAADRYTPLVMHVFAPPQWFRDTNGTYQLVYELELTNGIPVPVEATKVVVRDAKTGRAVARLSGKQLTAAMGPLAASYGEPSTTVAPSGVSVVWMEIPFKSRKQIPAEIEHTVTTKVPPGLPVPESIVSTGGASRVDLQAPVVIGPPVQGPGWVAAGACCDGPHRRALQPVNGRLALGQRFAVDFNRGNSEGRWVVGNPDVNQNWIFYGDPVLAVADGVVVNAVDKYPDQIPNHQKPTGLEEADGNHVILRFGKGRYAGYAHLIPGSVTVHDGQHVRRGQVIGRLGNSGASGGPHLHLQVMDKPSLVDSEGLPFAFSDFTFEGRIPPLSEKLEEKINAGDRIPVDPAGAGPRHDEAPSGRDVVAFP